MYLPGYAQKASFEAWYPKEFSFVLQFYNHNQKAFRVVTENCLLNDPLLAFAIVAPEIARYQQINDKLETRALELLYVNLGDDYANFSIGYFQIKPSFVEQLEHEILKSYFLEQQFSGLLIDATLSHVQRRSIRVQRLKDMHWQVQYLCCFLHYANHYFAEFDFSCKTDRLQYYASLYNSGIYTPPENIPALLQTRYFPNFAFRPNLNYADVAVEFYKKIMYTQIHKGR